MSKKDLYSGTKAKLRNTGRDPVKRKQGGGSQFKEIDWDQVKKAAHMQCTLEEIAGLMGVSHDTMERACMQVHGKPWKALFKDWGEGGKCSLRRKQWLLADKSAAMAIFLGKQMLGQKDDYGVKHSGNQKMEIVQYGDNPQGQWKEEINDKGSTESD